MIPGDGCTLAGPRDHTSDEDCAGLIDPETDLCKVCGVAHGDPCGQCQGRGFHRAGCPLMDGAE